MKKKLPFFLALIISVPIITLIVFLLAGVKADNANVADGESYIAALKDADINEIEQKIKGTCDRTDYNSTLYGACN